MNNTTESNSSISTDELFEKLTRESTFDITESKRFDSDGNRITHYLIYLIRNNVNGKIYVGQHVTDDIFDTYMGTGKIMKLALRKYGTDNFTKTILFDFPTYKEMDDKEREIVNEEFVKRNDTYNILVGGSGTYTREKKERENGVVRVGVGHEISEEDVEKNRQFQREMYKSGKWTQRNKGKKMFFDENGGFHYLGENETVPNGWTTERPKTDRDVEIDGLLEKLHSLGSSRKRLKGDSIQMMKGYISRWEEIQMEKAEEMTLWREIFEYYKVHGKSSTVKKYRFVKAITSVDRKLKRLFPDEYEEYIRQNNMRVAKNIERANEIKRILISEYGFNDDIVVYDVKKMEKRLKNAIKRKQKFDDKRKFYMEMFEKYKIYGRKYIVENYPDEVDNFTHKFEVYLKDEYNAFKNTKTLNIK